MTDYFSFQEALTKLKQGRKVTRAENDKFVFDGEHYNVEYIFLQDEELWVKPDCGIAPSSMVEARMWFHLDDMLAEDWYEVKTE